MKTHVVKAGDIEHRWYLVDAEGKTLGRLATAIARVIRGKHRPDFTPHLDLGDHVIVINAEKIHVTGQKMVQKTYSRYSGYQSGLKVQTLAKMLETRPEEVIKHAVHGMLPKNRLGRKLNRKLRVFAGASHPHGAQNPEVLEIEA
ncbi:MAG: 50S ribosomal protein L13 [Candidatus Krumholzibacteria bacterium]|jgi:large subunit ribosomal protein L13|nr:50S ribosomal protein L13 [Candidatus Krumholzibacteria bacterium]MDP6669565.1 50S ribosomal protein L13 [Candidatus Krumholzibacteria bacterium]MDP6796537.1 50S ribosomal protein L13 [Candidatus Krumholzibacteria bacterium]MDP7021742.1 50S ribosomal protein L13 [Candidatus Krumholzibacteria bacterium]